MRKLAPPRTRPSNLSPSASKFQAFYPVCASRFHSLLVPQPRLNNKERPREKRLVVSRRGSSAAKWNRSALSVSIIRLDRAAAQEPRGRTNWQVFRLFRGGVESRHAVLLGPAAICLRAAPAAFTVASWPRIPGRIWQRDAGAHVSLKYTCWFTRWHSWRAGARTSEGNKIVRRPPLAGCFLRKRCSIMRAIHFG